MPKRSINYVLSGFANVCRNSRLIKKICKEQKIAKKGAAGRLACDKSNVSEPAAPPQPTFAFLHFFLTRTFWNTLLSVTRLVQNLVPLDQSPAKGRPQNASCLQAFGNLLCQPCRCPSFLICVYLTRKHIFCCQRSAEICVSIAKRPVGGRFAASSLVFGRPQTCLRVAEKMSSALEASLVVTGVARPKHEQLADD